ncbi:MAG: DUF1353 domain-containing protein [Burkholderiales bacterium]|nr:DUF1353 domain-containing protein [Burkholderiales bacterium]
MRAYKPLLIVLSALSVLSGCASQAYRDTPNGKFVGELDVRWVKNDYFLFLPSQVHPFTFIRKDGSIVRPGPMYTDGGSIPRFLWGIKGYSPWGYAPAYIVHDWLFEAQHCHYAPDNQFSFSDSVSLMAEGLKAVMEQSPEVRNYFVFDTVVAAIGSPIAERLWEKGSCKAPGLTEKSLQELGRQPPGDLLMTIKFE